MIELIDSLNLVFELYKKELRCLFRDKDILIYGVLLPLLTIPTLWLVAMEAGFCYLGMTESSKTKVVIVGAQDIKDYLNKKLNESKKNIEVVVSANPQQDLQEGKIDFVAKVQNNEILLSNIQQRDPVGMVKSSVREALNSACVSSVQDALSAAHLPARIAQTFAVKEETSQASAPLKDDKNGQDNMPRLVTTLLMAILFVLTMTTTSSAMPLLATSEVEQRTLYTILMIPGQRLFIALSKYAAGLTVTWLSAVQFTFSILVAGVLMVTLLALQVSRKSLPATTNASSDSFSCCAHLTSWQITAIMGTDILLFGMALATACALYFLIASWARSMAEGMLLVKIPSSILTLLPITAFLPGMESSNIALGMPLMNLFLCMKTDHIAPLTVAAIVAEAFILITACIIIGDYISTIRNGFGAHLPSKQGTKEVPRA